MNLDSLFHNLLTSGITLSDPETLRKFKVANSFQIVCVMAAPFIGLLYFYIGALPLFYVIVASGLLMISSLIFLRATRNLALGSHYAILIIWACLFFISWHTGAVSYEGVLEPTFVLKSGLILLSVFLLGYSGGSVWTSIVFLETGLVVYLHRTGYPFPNLIPPEIAPIYSLGTYLVGLLCTLLFAFLFEKEKGEALIRDMEKTVALRESRKTMNDILDNSPVPTFVLDSNHRIVHWNMACVDLTGVPSAGILGKPVWEGFALDRRGSVADIILEEPEALLRDYKDSILSATDQGSFELKLSFPMLRSGAGAVVAASPIVDKAGVVRGAVQTIRFPEVSIKQQETVDRAPSAEIREMYDPPVFTVNAQEMVVHWNGACEREYLYPASEMIGKSIFTLVSKRYRPVFKEMMEGVFEGKSFTGRSLKYYTQEEKPVYVIAEAFPVKGKRENEVECAVINTDMTDLGLKMQKLELYAAEIKEKLKSLSEEHDLLKRNIASFIRRKDDAQ